MDYIIYELEIRNKNKNHIFRNRFFSHLFFFNSKSVKIEKKLHFYNLKK